MLFVNILIPGVLILFAVLEVKRGFLQSFLDLLGSIFAFYFALSNYELMKTILKRILPFLKSPSLDITSCIILFVITSGLVCVFGILLYGYTRFHAIDSLEGFFGAIFGFLVGWQVLRFIFYLCVIFNLAPGFTHNFEISGWGFYIKENFIPLHQWFLNTTQNLRHPPETLGF